MKNHLRLIIIVTVISLLFACSKKPTYKIEEVEGIKFVHNIEPEWGNKPKVELEFVKSIGGHDVTDENYQIYNSRDVIKDSEGNIYVVDSGNNRIQKYDSEGNYVTTIGKEGQGPGELLQPSSIIIDNENNLQVINLRNFRIEKFTRDGEFLKSYPMKRMFAIFRLLGTDKMVAPVINMQGLQTIPGSDTKPSLVSILNYENEVLSSFGSVKEFDNPMLTMMVNTGSIAVDEENNIFLAYAAENVIEKYNSEGELLLKFDRTLPFEISHEMKEREIDVDGRKVKFPFPDVSLVSSQCSFDWKNRLWVSTYFEKPVFPEDLNQWQSTAFPESMHLEIYSSDGIWLGKLVPPEGLSLIRIQGDTVFFFDKDLVSIHEYRIVES